MTTTSGLRERKKAATREALHRAAVRLAAEHGVEHVTVEAIADAATVSRRTFSNYFANKEQALLHADQVRLTHLVAQVRARPAAEPPWTALSHAVDGWLAEFVTEDPEELARYRALRRHPALLASMVSTYVDIERDLTAAIAERIPPGPGANLRARLLAANFLAATRVANQLWVENPERKLPEVMREALTMTAERFR